MLICNRLCHLVHPLGGYRSISTGEVSLAIRCRMIAHWASRLFGRAARACPSDAPCPQEELARLRAERSLLLDRKKELELSIKSPLRVGWVGRARAVEHDSRQPHVACVCLHGQPSIDMSRLG